MDQFSSLTLYPLDCSKYASEADDNPSKDETTPVTNINRAMEVCYTLQSEITKS